MTSPPEALVRIQAISTDPGSQLPSERLRAVADYLDVDDAKHGHVGTDVQDFLRSFADFLDSTSHERHVQHKFQRMEKTS